MNAMKITAAILLGTLIVAAAKGNTSANTARCFQLGPATSELRPGFTRVTAK